MDEQGEQDRQPCRQRGHEPVLGLVGQELELLADRLHHVRDLTRRPGNATVGTCRVNARRPSSARSAWSSPCLWRRCWAGWMSASNGPMTSS